MKISAILIYSMLIFSMQTTYAKLPTLPTMDVVDAAVVKTEREKITNFLNQEAVKKELTKNGVNAEEAIKRVASLSSVEVKNLSEQIEKSQAGGDFGVGGFLGAVVLIFLVLLVTDILGFTKVYPFTK